MGIKRGTPPLTVAQSPAHDDTFEALQFKNKCITNESGDIRDEIFAMINSMLEDRLQILYLQA